MNTTNQNNRIELLNTFSTIQKSFNEVKIELESHEADIKSELDKLKKHLNKDPWGESEIRKEHDFKTRMDDEYEKFRALFEQWIKDVESYDKRAAFRKRFGDSLLVFVYAKVKAGKSSLGNYLAYGYSKPSNDVVNVSDPKPEFFLQEANNSTEQISEESIKENPWFLVDEEEATSSIQGFSLPGLTWVDSPGIHSTTNINEKLTKEYIEAADVVVFLSNSSEPGRRSDIEEMTRLMAKNKPMLIVLTASDFYQEDEDEEGNIIKKLMMKTKEARQKQVDIVLGQIKAMELNPKIVTISQKYAEEKSDEPAHSSNRWVESGMSDFASELVAIADSSGFRVKQETPLQNLLSFCQNLVGSEGEKIADIKSLDSIVELKEGLENILEQINLEKREISDKCAKVKNTIQAKLKREIKKLTEKHADETHSNPIYVPSSHTKDCMTLFNDICKQATQKIGREFIQEFDCFKFNGLITEPKFPNIEAKFKYVIHEKKIAEKAGAGAGAAGGGWAGAEVGAALGTVGGPVGIAFGAVLGGIIGGWGGGKIGGGIGEIFNEKEKLSIPDGDNRDEVALQVNEELSKSANLHMDEIYRILEKKCFSDLATWCKELEGLVDKFQEKLESIITLLDKELNHGRK